MSEYATVFEPPIRPGGNWSAYVPDLPGCVSTGDTLDECRTMIREAVELHIAGLRRHGYDVPPASSLVETLQVAA